MNVLRTILLQALLLLFCLGGLCGVVLGIAMLARPEKVVALNSFFSRWLGSQKLREQLDRPRWIERYFYRHHRVSGTVLMLGAAFVLYAFLASPGIRLVSAYLPSGLRELWDALKMLLIVVSAVGLLVGATVIARPSLLRKIEASSNRWVSTEGMSTAMDDMNMSFDQGILRHRKIAGAFMVVGGLYVLLVLARFVWHADKVL